MLLLAIYIVLSIEPFIKQILAEKLYEGRAIEVALAKIKHDPLTDSKRLLGLQQYCVVRSFFSCIGFLSIAGSGPGAWVGIILAINEAVQMVWLYYTCPKILSLTKVPWYVNWPANIVPVVALLYFGQWLYSYFVLWF